MTVNDRSDAHISFESPSKVVGPQRLAGVPNLILRLQDSNRALENLLRELERDEAQTASFADVPDANPYS